MDNFKKICYVVISICIMLLAIKALIQSNGATAKYFEENLIMVNDGQFHEENNGKVVAIKGKLETTEPLKDERFGIEANNTPRLERKVLEYRYYDSKKNVSSYEEEDKSFKESTKWKTRWEDKSTVKEFIDNDEYQAQEIAETLTKDDSIKDVNAETFTLNPLLNGVFEIPEETLRKFPCNRPVIIDKNDGFQNELFTIENYNNSFILNNNEFTTVKGNTASVGDIRVSFKYLDLEKLGDVTVVAKQEDGKLVTYEGENMDIVFEVYKGNLSKEEIISKMKEDANYAILGVIITFIVLIIIGMVLFRDNISDFMNKKNIHIELSDNMIQAIVFITFLLFFIGIIIITFNVVKRTIRAQKAIPIEATVTSYRDEYHGSQIGYYYTYEYIVDDESYEKEYNNVDYIPFDPTNETDDGSIAKFEVYYDKSDPSKSYIAKERVHDIVFYIVAVFFFALFSIGMWKSASNIVKNNKKGIK